MRLINFGLGLLVGVTIGAAVVLLTTPQSGQDIQNTAKSRVDSLLDEGKKAFDTRRTELQTRMTELQKGNAA